MATTDAEQLQGIRTNIRVFIGRSGTDEITDDEIDILANDFFVTTFVNEIMHDSLEVDFTQEVLATDDGEFSLGVAIEEVLKLATFNAGELQQYFDPDDFFKAFPSEENYITAPTLVIGTSSASAVKNAAFDYKPSNWVLTKAAAETELTGSTVPQDKYGAWQITIDEDGTTTASPASGNVTGYTSVGQAINALAGSDDVIMGYVTAIDSDSTFIPGTTELSASGVTATFTDGNPGLRNVPRAFLVDGRKLFIRPKSCDKGLFESKLMVKRPDSLDSDTASVFDEKWGTCIALGTSISYLMHRGDTKKAIALKGDSETPGTYKYLKSSINKTWYIQQSKREAVRAW